MFAHRGGAALRPENTILAFDHGLSLGADGLEFDVHLSRDGVVVVHHDATLERTTNGRGPIAALTAGELARLDAGTVHSARRSAFAGGILDSCGGTGCAVSLSRADGRRSDARQVLAAIQRRRSSSS